jgi:hypothetical protein
MKPTIRAMQIREAKDFLVMQTAEQGALEGVPLSDLEKRMMYFTESKDALEDPASLNEEFEAQYDTAKFERKVSRLMRRAYRRLKKQDPEKLNEWNKAIRLLRRGDHYILVLCSQHLTHGSRLYWRLLAVCLLPFALFCLFSFLFSAHGRSQQYPPLLYYLPPLDPHVLRIVQALYLVLLFAVIFFPRALEPAMRIIWHCFDWMTGPEKEETGIRK